MKSVICIISIKKSVSSVCTCVCVVGLLVLVLIAVTILFTACSMGWVSPCQTSVSGHVMLNCQKWNFGNNILTEAVRHMNLHIFRIYCNW